MSWQERRCNAEGFGRPEPFFFLCEERTYSPPRRGGGIHFVARALCEADAAPAGASRQCLGTCECCCHYLCIGYLPCVQRSPAIRCLR